MKNGIILEDQKDYWPKRDAQVGNLKLGNFRFWKNFYDRFRRMDHLISTASLCGDCTCFARREYQSRADSLLTMSMHRRADWQALENTDGIFSVTAVWGIILVFIRDLSYDIHGPLPRVHSSSPT